MIRRVLPRCSIVGLILAILNVCIGCAPSGTSRTEDPSAETKAVSNSSPLMNPKESTRPKDNPNEFNAAQKIVFFDRASELGLSHSWLEQPRPVTAIDSFGSGCAAFDADGDGWQDILLVCDPHPKLFRNLEGVRFEEVTESCGLIDCSGNWTGCAVGDYNGDGLLDLLITGHHCLTLCKNLGQFRFELATSDAGLDSTNNGQWGSSAGFMDLDGDRWLDLVILNYVVFGPDSKKYCTSPNGIVSGCSPRENYPPEYGEIWRNTGSGRFELVPKNQAMQLTHGVALVLAFTDLDSDGRIDFYIGNDGRPAELMHNTGEMHFENIAQIAGVDGPEHGYAAAMGADWADYDRDGMLDLVITDWQGSGAVLYRNLGAMLFLNRSSVSSLTRNTKNRMGFGSKWTDFDNDRWPDLFIVNGHVYDNSAEIDGPDVPFRQSICLLANDRGMRFRDVLESQGDDVRRTMVGRGSATLDFNNDGRVDLLAVDFEGHVMLLENRTESEQHWLKIELRSHSPNTFAYGARVTGKVGDQIWISEVSPASSYLSSSDLRIHWGLGDAAMLDTLTIQWPSGSKQIVTGVAANQSLRIMEPDSGSDSQSQPQ